eukprot:TRINITY_DN5196_c0_g1_i2.p1 TRINITY_DN5196_c0_g1~~TRINITY_DN5196_c0_g1_i2.p1  ORF type:complete len:120 (-),score=39.29 TRINITY_DN5196_c0_g1_i2:175-534(-)
MDATHRRTVYVGGLEERVVEENLGKAFAPFGEIVSVNIPLDQLTQKNRGFGFVEFEEEEDARDAVDNMHLNEMFGRTIKVNIARPQKTNPHDKGIWESNADTYFKPVGEEGEEKKEEVS